MSSTAAADPELFPMTADERVAKARRVLEVAVDKAEKRADKAEEKADAARDELADFDAAIAAVRREG